MSAKDNNLSLSLVTTQKWTVKDAQELKKMYLYHYLFYKVGVALGPFITFCKIIKTFENSHANKICISR